MQKLSLLLVAPLLFQPQATTHAASVYRCSDAEGNISFNQHGCPPGSQVEERQLQRPNLMDSAPLAAEENAQYFPTSKWESAEQLTEIVVVGERDAVCGNQISPQERRQAIIRKQVRSGMTRADVESALGKPDRISGRNGQVSYHYQGKKGKKGSHHQVMFDEEGCVKGGR